MKLPTWTIIFLLIALLGVTLSSWIQGDSQEETIHIAVASNFADTMKALVRRFETNHACRVRVSLGSTGKHYAQIVNGAPFDLFFAADRSRPERLEHEAFAVRNTRFTYAQGRIVLWSSNVGYVDSSGEILKQGRFRHLAMANPRFAPYGKAAQEVLDAFSVAERLADRVVFGENVAQAYQFIDSGNAELGFVAYSQVKRLDETERGSYWEVPRTFYSPIEQQAILLRDGTMARAFWEFVQSPEALMIIRDHGYDIP